MRKVKSYWKFKPPSYSANMNKTCKGLVNGFGGILIADLYHLPIIGLL
ncbi:hypothetical protein [Algoriphagus lacus]|nr:hypothetical protein [Algoriphagus lacus]